AILLLSCGKKSGEPPYPKVLQPVLQNQNPPTATELQNKKTQAVGAILQSKLGKLVDEFLFADLTPEQQNDLSHKILDEVYGQANSAITAVSAIQLLVEDYNQRHQFGIEQSRRMAIFEGDLRQRDMDVSSYPGEGLAYLAAAAFIAALPFGYAPARNALKYVTQRPGRWFAYKLGWEQ